jgi:hypothetical protein
MTRFQLTIRCTICGTRYKGVVKVPDEAALDLLPDPPCPTCKRKARRKKFDYVSQVAPAVVGSLRVRAVDQTAEIVMTDHQMTDLRSDVREGETMAPKLPPRLQAMADNMFARPRQQRQQRGGIFDLPPRAVMQAAVSGRFNTRDTVNPVAIQHARKDSAPVHIIAGDGVRSG